MNLYDPKNTGYNCRHRIGPIIVPISATNPEHYLIHDCDGRRYSIPELEKCLKKAEEAEDYEDCVIYRDAINGKI